MYTAEQWEDTGGVEGQRKVTGRLTFGVLRNSRFGPSGPNLLDLYCLELNK